MQKINLEAVSFRTFCAEDEARAAAFFEAMGQESRALFNRRDYNKNGLIKFCRRGDQTRRYLMAEYKGEMVGYVFFLDFDTAVPELGLAVRDDLRGIGLGGHILDYAIGYARGAGKGGILLTTHVANLRAQTLYESRGFACKGLTKNGTELFYLWRDRT